ncbi:MAG: hypothetical protein JWM82_2858 [Myxococcales bacterium]|nr:hypothetical protein [Myxococcales bacterium]
MAPWRSRRAICALALGGSFLLAPKSAEADEPLGITLSYEAPPGCPSAAELAHELRARVDASWLRGSDARRFDARIVRHDRGDYSGRLEIAQPGRAVKVRVIEAKTCRAVVISIAVFLAIALDPSSEDAPEPPSATEPPPVESPKPIEQPPPPERPAIAPKPPPPAPPAPKTLWIWTAGVDATYLRAPEAAWGSRVRAELARTREHQRLAPALRLSWGFSSFSTFPERAGEAKFLLKTARLEGCLRVDLAPIFANACGGADMGTLAGRTPVLRQSVAHTVQWIAAVTALRVTWAIVPWLAVSGEASITVPFERTSFALANPPRLVYRAPAALFGAGTGLGVTAQFP